MAYQPMGSPEEPEAGSFEAAPPTPAAQQGAPSEAVEHRVRLRAHEIWVEEGKPDGRDVHHWLKARWEIESEGDQADPS